LPREIWISNSFGSDPRGLGGAMLVGFEVRRFDLAWRAFGAHADPFRFAERGFSRVLFCWRSSRASVLVAIFPTTRCSCSCFERHALPRSIFQIQWATVDFEGSSDRGMRDDGGGFARGAYLARGAVRARGRCRRRR